MPFLPRLRNSKSDLNQNNILFIFILWAVALIFVPDAHSQGASGTQAMQLSTIEVVG